MTERVTVNAAQTDDGPHMPSWMDEDAVTYAQAGVDTAEGARAVEAIKGVVHDTYRPEVVGDIGGFGGLFSIAAAKSMDDPLLVSGTDGVGTKLKVAQMAGKHDTVGIDLVAMCANDILATGAEPLFFLDYVAIGKLKAENVAEIVAGIGEELGGRSLQDALLEPTRIYVKPVRAVLEACEGAVHALAHITGGGISENLDRALPESCAAEVDLGTWPVPAIASFVCDAAHLDEAEALKTFNMGLGMVLIVDAARADEVEAALTQAGETTYRVGRIVAGEGEVRYANDGKLYGFGAEA